MDQVKIGNYVRELRKSRELTQEQMAEKFNVSRRTVSRWETGMNMPDLDILLEMSDFFDVDLREILEGAGKKEMMNEEVKDTVLKVAEYSNEQKKRTAKVVLVFFVIGIVAQVVKLAMEFMELPSTFVVGFVEGVTSGITLGAMILGMMYVTGSLFKVREFKLRLIGREMGK